MMLLKPKLMKSLSRQDDKTTQVIRLIIDSRAYFHAHTFQSMSHMVGSIKASMAILGKLHAPD